MIRRNTECEPRVTPAHMASRVRPIGEESSEESGRIAPMRVPARACDDWHRSRGIYFVPSPAQIVKSLVWLMRDRGMNSPDDMRGVTHTELRIHAGLRRKKRGPYPTFDASLEAAIAEGLIASYESKDGEIRYLPNYARDRAHSED